MTVDEKINLIDSFDCLDILDDEHFQILKALSLDDDAFLRSRCAAQLVNFSSEDALNLLLFFTKDTDSLVRTEAFDSLGAYYNKRSEESLYQAMRFELDSMARSYSILSWADVSITLYGATTNQIRDLKRLKSLEKSSNCVLSYCYALYVCGETKILDELLTYLKNEDYHIRCAAISLLDDIIDESNEKLIKDTISELLIIEDAVAVKKQAEKFLRDN